MAINERLVHTASAAVAGSGNQEEGLILYLDANDVDSYDGDGSVWYDITNHEYKPATNVSEHFNTVTYTGNGTTKNVTGVGFQPDLVWIKARSVGYDHQMHDSLRGAGYGLLTNLTAAEGNYSTVNSFDSDGFSVDASSYVGTNANNATFVAWCFKAGGAPSGSDKVSIDGTSYATMTAAGLTDGTEPISKLSVNTKLGFSIVEYTAPALTGDTVAHGLGETPEMIILKSTNVARNWSVFHKDVGTSKNLHLNTTDAANTSEYWTANSNTFSIQDYSASADWIAYAFTSKRGVSKVGSYTGTGAAGNKVYTGFEPAFVIVKSTSFVERWAIYDNKRSVNDPRSKVLAADRSDAEIDTIYYNIDFDRDGFTVNGTANFSNKSGESFIYYAVAKNTNETSLIPDTDLELHLDPTSYSGSGTTWTADTGSNATVVASRYDQELGDSFDISTDGESTIQIASGHGLNGTNFTLEFWYKWQSTPSAANRFIYDAGTGWNFFYYGGSGWRINNDDCATGYFSSSEGVTVGKWYHFVITQNSSQNKVYIDGELLKTTSVTSGTRSLAAFDFGTTEITADKPKCDIGQIRTYSAALTQDQIRQNFNFTKNDYPNGYNGTISGATWNSGGYFDFDGSNDYVKIDPLPITNYICSHSFWMKTTDSSTYYVTSFRNPIYFGFGLGITTAGKYTFAMYDGTNTYSLEMSTADSNIIKDGNWHHIVLTNGNSVGKIYLDGVYNSQIATSTTQFSYGSVNAIGQRADLINSSPYDGFISKFKVYDKELTQAEITALYNEGE